MGSAAGNSVKCPVCEEKFNANKVPSVKIKGRYYHQECFDSLSVKPTEGKKKNDNLKKCFYCNEYFDITTEDYAKPVTNRYAHKKCYDENHTEDEAFIGQIYSYLSKELLIKVDFVQCEKQRKAFIKKNGYTNEGILLALKYFYEVKKQSADRSGNRIGIVPYVYDEAQAYYSELKKRKKQINKGLAKQLEKKAVKIKVIGEEKPKEKEYIDIDSIVEGDD